MEEGLDLSFLFCGGGGRGLSLEAVRVWPTSSVKSSLVVEGATQQASPPHLCNKDSAQLCGG